MFSPNLKVSILSFLLSKVCQTHRWPDVGCFKNCQCLVDTRDKFVSEDLCMIIQYHIGASIPFLNMFQMKVVRSKKWVLLGSRHFPGELDIPPQNGKEATKLALYIDKQPSPIFYTSNNK
ncbi:hypothetical protein RF11_11720 [Thelohanellus kitauei]|uniref:Uncharacterized protein n=1 Tax=Thelohanellus kitauei TaxID=669202 RepID=A0A0C2JTS0_THEKT|nr:hypothetical protein RF11_11720 [Thelohanellus kitauei]